MPKPRSPSAIRESHYGGLLPETRREEREEYAGIREWQAEHAIARLFRTSIRLQTAFDRCFQRFGMTAQEAAVLLHCVDEGETSAGKLARRMGRDKGKITRFVDRLETGGFLSRRSDLRDHRLLVLKATKRGRRAAPQLRRLFDDMRSAFFHGVLNADLDRLGNVLTQLHANAERLCAPPPRKVARR
jgi:DNA-binding MarR family transcriptional regulator